MSGPQPSRRACCVDALPKQACAVQKQQPHLPPQAPTWWKEFTNPIVLGHFINQAYQTMFDLAISKMEKSFLLICGSLQVSPIQAIPLVNNLL